MSGDASDGDHDNDSTAPAGAGDERTHDPETVPLDLDEGEDVVIQQQASGADQVLGSGEFPDPDAPPQDPAPGG